MPVTYKAVCALCGQVVECEGDQLKRHRRRGIGRDVLCNGKKIKPPPAVRKPFRPAPRDKNGQTPYMRKKDRVMGYARVWPAGTLKRGK